MARAAHSAVSLHDPDCDPANPAVLVMWGEDDDNEVVNDWWIFHVNQKLWRKVLEMNVYMQYVICSYHDFLFRV